MEEALKEQCHEIMRSMGASEPLIEKVQLEWSTRMRVVFGRTIFTVYDWTILDPVIRLCTLAWKHCSPEERTETLTHECAHLVAEERLCTEKREEPMHGKMWKGIMVEAGYAPAACGVPPEAIRKEMLEKRSKGKKRKAND